MPAHLGGAVAIASGVSGVATAIKGGGADTGHTIAAVGGHVVGGTRMTGWAEAVPFGGFVVAEGVGEEARACAV